MGICVIDVSPIVSHLTLYFPHHPPFSLSFHRRWSCWWTRDRRICSWPARSAKLATRSVGVYMYTSCTSTRAAAICLGSTTVQRKQRPAFCPCTDHSSSCVDINTFHIPTLLIPLPSIVVGDRLPQPAERPRPAPPGPRAGPRYVCIHIYIYLRTCTLEERGGWGGREEGHVMVTWTHAYTLSCPLTRRPFTPPPPSPTSQRRSRQSR